MSTNLKGRLEIRLSPEDRDAVLNAAKSEGVNKSEWCRRVFASVLGTPKVETGPREAKDGLAASRLARPSIPSEAPASQGSEGVRPAVQSQTPPARDLMTELKASLKPGGSDVERIKNRCPGCGEEWPRCPGTCLDGTSDGAPSEPQMSRSAQRMAAATGGRAPHLPKCTCAVCVPSKPEAARKPRPKTGKGKK